MTIESDLFDGLSSLVGTRVYPIDFPQAETLMVWPAIRYTFVSIVPIPSICGDYPGTPTADIRVQIDVVHTDPDLMRALRDQVLVVMRSFDPPAINEDITEVFDSETKTYRAILDFMIYQ
jgi:hypothetical protein